MHLRKVHSWKIRREQYPRCSSFSSCRVQVADSLLFWRFLVTFGNRTGVTETNALTQKIREVSSSYFYLSFVSRESMETSSSFSPVFSSTAHGSSRAVRKRLDSGRSCPPEAPRAGAGQLPLCALSHIQSTQTIQGDLPKRDTQIPWFPVRSLLSWSKAKQNKNCMGQTMRERNSNGVANSVESLRRLRLPLVPRPAPRECLLPTL